MGQAESKVDMARRKLLTALGGSVFATTRVWTWQKPKIEAVNIPKNGEASPLEIDVNR